MKNVLFFMFVILVSATTIAQRELRFGVKGGLNISSFGGEGKRVFGGFEPADVNEFRARKSFHVGAILEGPINDRISLQGEALYSSKGVKYFNDSLLKLDYIDLSLLGKYYFIKGFSAELGPVIGILVTASADGFGTAGYDVRSSYSSIDLGGSLGLTYRLKFGVFLTIRYTKGLNNNNNAEPFINQREDNLKNQNDVFQVSLGYSF